MIKESSKKLRSERIKRGVLVRDQNVFEKGGGGESEIIYGFFNAWWGKKFNFIEIKFLG